MIIFHGAVHQNGQKLDSKGCNGMDTNDSDILIQTNGSGNALKCGVHNYRFHENNNVVSLWDVAFILSTLNKIPTFHFSVSQFLSARWCKLGFHSIIVNFRRTPFKLHCCYFGDFSAPAVPPFINRDEFSSSLACGLPECILCIITQ